MTEPFYTVDTLEAPKSIGFLVKRCGGLMSQLAERRFATEQVSFTQWMVLATLGRYEHMTATALSEETCHDMGALTRVIDDLEEEGLVRRERSERDRRVVEIALTPEGRRYLQTGKRLVVQLLNSLAEPFSREELETLIALLQRMMARLQEAAAASAGPQPQRPAAPRARTATKAARPRRLGRAGTRGAT
ncbi:MAG TPA: MarR family winged helix-turn-helix transcriptional regulator [Steroidobacteraceae bacterium]|nr:MarR family winged helix-turn-helix transcriptional regulator [Steroidobacteraceae bacterium]